MTSGSPQISKEVNGQQNGQSQDVQNIQSNNGGREQWASKWEFLLSCIGMSVGLGNVWRFPYLAYQNGGGAFLVAYVVMMVIIGKPLFFAELALGQFAGVGTIRAWRCFPIAKGIGIAMTVMCAMVGIYYNVIMCYTLFYMVQSFRSELPWKDCFSWWGADQNCHVRESNETYCSDVEEMFSRITPDAAEPLNTTQNSSGTWPDVVSFVPVDGHETELQSCINATQTASEQFWERHVLRLSSGIDELGAVKWDLVLSLFVCWIIVFLGMIKGIKSTGKVVYFTATFPYVILLTLVIYGCTLDGANEGLKYFFIPKWDKLLDIQVWKAAAEQLLYSLGIGWGCLMMYSSYNNFGNKLYRDAMCISIMDFLTSIFAGTVIFTVLGHMATEMGVDISQVAKGGQGLAFVTYPEALAKLPVPQLFSFLFFFMLFLLAIDSEFSFLETLFTCIYDEYPKLKSKKVAVTGFFCCIFFILGLPCVTEGGQYVLNLMDSYGGGKAAVIVVIFENMALMWGYGSDRFSNDIEFMLGFRPSLYWRICWKYLSPCVLIFVLVYSFSQHKIIEYAGVPYPMWAEVLGWFLVLVSVLQIPIWGAKQLWKHKQNIKYVFHPHPDWGPADPDVRQEYFLHLSSKSVASQEGGGSVNIGMNIISEQS